MHSECHEHLRPSNINKVFLVQAFSKFGAGGPYYLLVFKFVFHFCVKFKLRLQALFTNPENGEALNIFSYLLIGLPLMLPA